MSSFLELPIEVRLVIYGHFLDSHRRVANSQQPNNSHFALLHTCRQIAVEANHLRSYVSLTDDSQIARFICDVGQEHCSLITQVDVANDTRMVMPPSPSRVTLVPISDLHLALRKLINLSCLRVFDASRRTRPANYFVPGSKFSLQFERAMFPFGAVPRLVSYELFLVPSTSIHTLFQVTQSMHIRKLRLSGGCVLYRGSTFPSLCHLTIHGVTGHYLDQHMEEHLTTSQLETFQYDQGDRLGFELRDPHLVFLSKSASTLTRLVLLGCSKISGAGLYECLETLSSLQYFALSLTTVHDLQAEFVSALPLSLMTLKLRVTNAPYSQPLIQAEHNLCDIIERTVILKNPAPQLVYLDLRCEILLASERNKRWATAAKSAHYLLRLGPWEKDEII